MQLILFALVILLWLCCVLHSLPVFSVFGDWIHFFLARFCICFFSLTTVRLTLLVSGLAQISDSRTGSGWRPCWRYTYLHHHCKKIEGSSFPKLQHFAWIVRKKSDQWGGLKAGPTPPVSSSSHRSVRRIQRTLLTSILGYYANRQQRISRSTNQQLKM